ncbi:hypothetical protein C8Q75DRAFT_782789 [Abortiporus biennis]|nr:hypothetical protein C8Q75DRAFT_782789 [Abortiporus biennis]
MADTPSSEASVYFDAESIDMGLFSKNHDSPKPQTSAIGGQNEAARTGTSTFDEPSPSRTYATSPSQPSNNPQPTSMFFNMEPQTAGAEPLPQSHPSPTPARNNYGDDRDRTPTFPQPQPSAATYGDRGGTAHGPSYLSSSTAEGDGGATASDSGYGSTASPQRRTKSLSRTTGVGEETSGLATRNNIPPPVSESSGPQVGRGDGGVGRQQQQQRVGGDAESIKAIPVVWSDGGEGNDQNYADGGMNQSGSTNAMRQRSVRSQRSVGGAGAGIGRNNSMRSFRSNRGGGDQESLSGRQTSGVNSVGGRQRRASLSGGTFAAGAGMIGPDGKQRVSRI